MKLYPKIVFLTMILTNGVGMSLTEASNREGKDASLTIESSRTILEVDSRHDADIIRNKNNEIYPKSNDGNQLEKTRSRNNRLRGGKKVPMRKTVKKKTKRLTFNL